MSTSVNQYVFKIIIAGDTGVGKTSLVRRYVDNEFIPSKKATIGIDYFLKSINLANMGLKTTSVSLQIWDLAGEEKYRTFLPAYIPGTNGIFFVYSEDVKKSFNYLNDFMVELKKLLKEPVPIILIKAKIDIAESIDMTEDVKEFMKKNGIDVFIDTSAKTGQNVNKAFQEIAKLIVKENNLI